MTLGKGESFWVKRFAPSEKPRHQRFISEWNQSGVKRLAVAGCRRGPTPRGGRAKGGGGGEGRNRSAPLFRVVPKATEVASEGKKYGQRGKKRMLRRHLPGGMSLTFLEGTSKGRPYQTSEKRVAQKEKC